MREPCARPGRAPNGKRRRPRRGLLWVPDRESAYDVSRDARAPTLIDELSDDVDTIGEIVSEDDERFIAIGHDLTHIIGVLARLAALDTPDL